MSKKKWIIGALSGALVVSTGIVELATPAKTNESVFDHTMRSLGTVFKGVADGAEWTWGKIEQGATIVYDTLTDPKNNGPS